MKENVNVKGKVLSSLVWKLLERGGSQGIQFVVQIILARLLLPEDFGIIAIVMVFISLAQVFVQSGFNTALIQKKDADEEDFSSVLYLSLTVAVVLYIVIFVAAPFIADYYLNPILVPVLRVISISLIFGAFNSIQNAYIARKMMFKKLFHSSLGAIILSGFTGIASALSGLGVWALVLQLLVNQISVTIIMWFTVKWRPRLVFSFEKIKVLFSFGWKLLVSTLISALSMDIRTLIIGRVYSSSMLGYYNRGEQFPKVIVTNINGSIQSVMLPTLSAHQDNKLRLKQMVRRSILTSSFLIFPMMIGLAIVAEPLVDIILTEKWLPAVPFLQLFCISYALIPIHTANLQAINALGRSDIFLKLEIIKKVISLIILIISMPFGVYAIALGVVISGIISSFINAHPNKQLLDYSYKEQWEDIIPALLISVLMGAIVYLFNLLNLLSWQKLLFQILTGIIVYVCLAKIFKIESYSYLIATFKELITRADKK